MKLTVYRYTTTSMQGGRPVKRTVPVFTTDIPEDQGAVTVYLGGEPALVIEPDGQPE